MLINSEHFSIVFPHCTDPKGLVRAMNELLPKHGIDNKMRVAAFLSQCGHETGGWSKFSENLNYSSKGLNKVFPKYFKDANRDAREYHRKPPMIANVVYANRMGNGDTESGEGWKYRGRGAIQLTGKNNYIAFKKDTGIDVINNPDIIVNDKKISILAAIWYWNRGNLNRWADLGDMRKVTKAINGGYNGITDRIHHYERVILMLNNDTDKPLENGDDGERVKAVQKSLGITSDGIFGNITEKAVITWQYKNNQAASGTVDNITFIRLTDH